MSHEDLQKFADGLVGLLMTSDPDGDVEDFAMRNLKCMKPGKAEYVIFAHEQLNKMRISAAKDMLESN